MEDHNATLIRNLTRNLMRVQASGGSTKSVEGKVTFLFRQLKQRAIRQHRLPAAIGLDVLNASLHVSSEPFRPADWRRILFFAIPADIAQKHFPDVHPEDAFKDGRRSRTSISRMDALSRRLPGSFECSS